MKRLLRRINVNYVWTISNGEIVITITQDSIPKTKNQSLKTNP